MSRRAGQSEADDEIVIDTHHTLSSMSTSSGSPTQSNAGPSRFVEQASTGSSGMAGQGDVRHHDQYSEKPDLHSRLPSSTSAFGKGHEGDDEHGHGHGHHRHRSETSGSAALRRTLLAGAHKKEVKRSPWVTRPMEGIEDEWVHPDLEATEWLSLFYDLVVVAVLSIFSNQHEIANPAAIPVFLSFFTIIFWTWTSQTAYDMRYQGNDAVNRFFKFIQVGLFIYQGAASGNWNPGRIEVWIDTRPEDLYGAKLAKHEDALRSWLTVVTAFAVSRAVLAIQYAICLIQARKVKRQYKHFLLTIGALLVSCVLAAISAAIPSTNYSMKIVKICLFYLGIVVELADGWVQLLLKISPGVASHKVGERYGAFLIIILGEGIISISRAFNRSISGLSDDDSGTYIQVFLTVLIVYLLWSFLFSNFDKNDHTGHGRAAVWQTLHFPLAFGILLLIAGMVNVVLVISSAHGIGQVSDLIDDIADKWIYQGIVPSAEFRHANRYLTKLSLEPSFPDMMDKLAALSRDANADEDWYLLLEQYAGQIVVTAFQLYGVEIPEEAQDEYHHLYAINTTWVADEAQRNATRTQAEHMQTDITAHILIDAFSGVLWLLPVAGGVLILAALRSMAWYRFKGAAHWIIHATQIIFGAALALLGLLDIGQKSFDITKPEEALQDVNPLYKVLFHEVPLIIVAVVYLVVWLTSSFGLILIDRRARKRSGVEHGAGNEGGVGGGGGGVAVPIMEEKSHRGGADDLGGGTSELRHR